MLNNKFFFNDYSFSSKKFNSNLKKTKQAFSSLKTNIDNFENPLFECFMKSYVLNFSSQTIGKFSNCKNIIIIGMGGSVLGIKAIYSFFKKKINKKIFFFDNLDENLLVEFKKIKNIKKSCFIVISKSGNTLETLVNLDLVFSKHLFKKNLIVITEIKDSSLINVANKFGAEIIEHKNFIGGRFSVLSEVGMLPSALMKLNINQFRNLERLINNKKFVSCLIKNVTTIYSLNTKGIRNSVILNYNSKMNDLCFWYQQLVAESLGKKGKGVTPIISFAPKDHHSILQLYLDGPKDKFFTFFNSGKKENKYKVRGSVINDNMKFLKNKNLGLIINSQFNATKNVFKLKKIPFREFIFKKNNEEELGLLFTFFILETILLAKLINVNPFDQPAVEKVKVETKKILSK